ncbi:nuclear transport factor 2 family protein [Paracoccus alkenifer]|uniref:DUF4440 domain-containing protein n=1 Tax=Paracoccus alkenifer TaxID=65735 RepID=A0A1H6LQ73_9RHOB|nr:nuclear transport factor 2 family protein [Paracoccus alkenifer]SEH90845.1 protein of unknown function [Paracoccus alkenifer]
MGRTTDRWGGEEALWTMGAAEAALRIAPVCIMVFPEGVMQGPQIIDGMKQGSRWKNLRISQRHTSELGDTMVLAYRARATRGTTQCDVLCSSTWVRQGGDWKLIQHQQTLPATD